MNILITGGDGKLAKEIAKQNTKHKIELVSKSHMDIKNYDNVMDVLTKKRPNIVIHAAALTKPMLIHDSNISKSISNNIIGTANVVMACYREGVKLIYISTDYVYPINSQNNSEHYPLLPFTNYGWSKLGGECAVQMYENSLIIRTTFMDRPFSFEKAYTNVYRNIMYIDDAAKAILNVLDKKGILNIGGEKRSIYRFALETKPDVKKEINNNTKISNYLTLNVDKYLKS